MKSAIRLAVMILMASTSTAALAGGSEASADARDSAAAQHEAMAPSPADTKSEDTGHGSGEPGAALTMNDAERRAAERDAIAEYNQENYLRQTWMATP